MASSEPPPWKKKFAPAAPTTISALGDDLLCEVFLRPPSLPSLVRAALTCPAFLRAVRSSPSFRRRFRDLHPAPILGVFLNIHDPATPAFVSIRCRSDPDHGAELFLNRLIEEEEEEEVGENKDENEGPRWSMTACHNGYVVLVNRSTKLAAVYDPLTRGMHHLCAPPVEIFEDVQNIKAEFYVVTPEEDRRSFRVVCVYKEMDAAWWAWGGGVHLAVFSPDSKEWQIFPKAGSLEHWVIDQGMLANGSVYWTSRSGRDLHVLNTATLQLSQIDRPLHEARRALFCRVGETSDGKTCVAQLVYLTLEVWVRRADSDGVDRWMPDTTFPMPDAIGKLELQSVDAHAIRVVTIIGGIVYLSIDQISLFGASSPWLLSFSIETKELKKVCPIIGSRSSYPYVMAWPPVLVGGKVNSGGLEGA